MGDKKDNIASLCVSVPEAYFLFFLETQMNILFHNPAFVIFSQPMWANESVMLDMHLKGWWWLNFAYLFQTDCN